ncbi:lipid asymmetry maintenance protein MlaB [Actinobacillus porcinus]|uniref:Anti-sigma-factor antagonist n=1 Tax=Actinobacillus porcinus TaxID=51048 RepID=A0ABY6TNC8_9PAST|nr:STAS domain-containing protein [Actinobacillus porcinus]MDD7544029.1 STAS domain-containing protein [Actinobacillus porcinus]MDY5847498.1 STAS domain-containing protein [Actinobacillus porcinus]VFY93837.1 anti-sigma-factor antagonist [Actinobacillus porcinus]VTU09260.1 anti-sigma-factor antagonist [Actinobacillus porcinus]
MTVEKQAQTTAKLTWSAIQNNDKIALRLAGELSRNTLLPLWNEWKRQQRFAVLSTSQMATHVIEWDLSSLTRMDSAGFALFSELLHDIQKMAVSQKIINVPDELMTLAELFDLDNWLKTFID